MDNLQYDYLVSEHEGVVMIDVEVEDEIISCNFLAIKKGMDKKQLVYCPETGTKYQVLIPDEMVDQIVPVSVAGDIILHRIKDATMSTNT